MARPASGSPRGALGRWPIIALLLAGCASVDEPPARPRAEVTGTVTYRLRVALPPQAVVRVSLSDVSRADAPAALLARSTIATQGRQVPIPFALSYDPERIGPRAEYAVDARIEAEGRVLFATTRRYAVITRGHPVSGLEIVVDPPGLAPDRTPR
jgi:uncharacterized lipoprotein YbaY